MAATSCKRTFRVVLIKPSHYDRDGYVIQWRRSTLPSNSLASVYGLMEECARQRVLGPDVDIEIEACDECNTIVDVAGVAKRIRAAGGGMVGLIGVQSNQFPRALDLGRRFRAQGLTVVMGGFHVSGCISMLPELPPEIREAHNDGEFHIHDLGILSVYCVGWDLQDLLLSGFKGASGKVESKFIESTLMEAARRSKAHIVQSVFHQFNPHGVSGVVVISESHFSVHTWPEYGYAAVDLFSCGESIDYKTAMNSLATKLKSKHVTSVAIQRGLVGIPRNSIR